MTRETLKLKPETLEKKMFKLLNKWQREINELDRQLKVSEHGYKTKLRHKRATLISCTQQLFQELKEYM